MSIELTVTFEGADELEEYFNSLSDRLREVVVSNIEEIVAQGVDIAKALAPVRTGYLVSTIDADQLGETGYLLYCTAPYAVYQEFGTSRIMPRQFMTAAWELIVEAISDRILGAYILGA
jgi:HK97 gp10 family phage protein